MPPSDTPGPYHTKDTHDAQDAISCTTTRPAPAHSLPLPSPDEPSRADSAYTLAMRVLSHPQTHNAPSAARLLTYAAGLGHGRAALRLAALFEFGGPSFPPDLPQALGTYALALHLGAPAAAAQMASAMLRARPPLERPATDLLSDLATVGFAPAMFLLAVLLAEGKLGPEPDIPNAARLLVSAAHIGDRDAIAYLTGGREAPPAIAQLFAHACTAHDAVALFKLAKIRFHGTDGLAPCVVAAYALWLRAADLGDTASMTSLAILLQCGKHNVKQDLPAALRLYERAIRLGNVTAMVHLGCLYFHGIVGGQRNYQAAMRLWERGVRLGDSRAMANLGIIFYNGFPGIQRNVSAALRLWGKAKLLGEANAPLYLAQGFRNGSEGFEKDLRVAMEMYNLAAERGCAEAMFELGSILYHGYEEIEVNIPGALDLWRRAAKNDHVGAIEHLTLMLDSGGAATEMLPTRTR